MPIFNSCTIINHSLVDYSYSSSSFIMYRYTTNAAASEAGAVSASAPALEASLPAVMAVLPSVEALTNADDDMDVFVGAGIVDAGNLAAAAGKLLPAEHAVEVGAKCLVPNEASLPAVVAVLPSVEAQPSADDDMDVFVGTGNVDACELTAAAGKLSQAEHAVEVGAKCLVPNEVANAIIVMVGDSDDACNLTTDPGKLSQSENAVAVVAKSPYEGNTTVGLALLQAGATDGIQTQVSTVIVYAILFII
jgi:hypothetical protein